MPSHEDHLLDLCDTSAALVTALRERSPRFLEFLERRERALLALRNAPLGVQDLPLLQAAMAAGEAATQEALSMRQESLAALNRLQSRRSLSRGLSASTPPQPATLDVCA